MARFNKNAILLEIQKPMVTAYRQAAIKQALEIVEEVKGAFLERFIDDEVSQEIRKEPEEGTVGLGNLFGFIGFEEGSDPVGDLYEFLEANIYLNDSPTFNKSSYIFKVIIPDKNEIEQATPMPWGTSKSWAFAIETGISGLNNYLYEKGKGRSKEGLQVKKKVFSGSYTARPYLTPLLKFLRDSF